MSGLYSRARHAWRNDGRGRRAGFHRWFTTPAGGGARCAPRGCRCRQTGLPGTSDAACRSSWRGDGSGPCRGHGDGSGRRERRRRHLREQPPAPKWVTGEEPPRRWRPRGWARPLAGKAATKQAADLRGEWGGSPTPRHAHKQKRRQAVVGGWPRRWRGRREVDWSGVSPARVRFIPSSAQPTKPNKYLSLFSLGWEGKKKLLLPPKLSPKYQTLKPDNQFLSTRLSTLETI